MSIKDFFRDEWAGVAPAWERWGATVERQTAAATAWIVALGRVRAGMHVLDLASGTGDPALSLARRVGPAGRVVATDLVSGALAVTGRAAAAAGLGNVVTRVADMEALPFADATFDAVTCRLGLMFCPDPSRALAEARRVLRPGGRAAFVVWGSPRQPLFEATLGRVRRALSSGIAAEGGASGEEAGPGPFRFADPAALSRLVLSAGFGDPLIEERTLPWPFDGGGAELWRMFVDLAGPSLSRRLDALAAPARRALDDEIAAALDGHSTAGSMVDPGAVLIGAVGAR